MTPAGIFSTLFLVLGIGAALPLQAVAPEFKLGIGENVRRQDPPGGGPFIPLQTSLANRGVQQDFITHWFHQGWRNAFPDSGVSYLAGYCNSGSEFNNLASYQGVLNAGKRLVLVWWWHNDNPCDLTQRTDAENTLRDCLVPMIQALAPGPGLGSQVYVVLQPEYNRYDACNAYSDASWSTHMNILYTHLQGINVPGLTVKAGPSVGDWAYDRSAYQVEGSLNGSIANADFVAFHNIYRRNSDHPLPADTHFPNPSPDQIEHAVSYARYLKLRFGKPVLYAYQSTNTSNYGDTAQAEALLDTFRRRAALEAADVELFGPFWLFPDPGYPGESLISGSNVERPAFAVWRDESNAVIAGVDRTHSIAFLSPDQGHVSPDSSIQVQWISRGRPQTASAFELEVSVNGGAYSLVASGLPGDDSSIMSYNWDACALAPAPDLRLRLRCLATGAEAVSGRFAVKKLSASSNAQHHFESGTHGWVNDGNATVTRVGGETYFHGASSGSLRVVSNFNSSQNSYIANTSPGISITGTPRFTALIYVPFDLNPCTIPGAEVSKVIIDMQAGSYLQSPQILLQQGWNRVSHVFTGASGPVTYLKINFNNKWGYAGNPPIYVDEIRIGDDLSFTGGSCASPSPTPIVPVGTPTATPTAAVGTATATPTRTVTPSASPTSPAACAPEYHFNDGTTQGLAAASPAVISVAASPALPYEGSHSLAVGLALNATNSEALVSVTAPGFPKDYSGQVLTFWLYLPAGMSNASNPSGSTLFVKTGSGWAWSESPWLNLPSTAGWVQVSLDMSAVPNANDVRELGVKIALGGASPPWSGTVYIDALGPTPTCPSPTTTQTPLAAGSPTATATPTATRTRTGTPTPSSTRTRTATLTLTATGTRTGTPTPSPTPSASASPSGSPTQSVTLTPDPASPTSSPTASASPSSTPELSPTPTPSISVTASETVVLSATPSPTGTSSATSTPSPEDTATASPSPSSTLTPDGSLTATPTPTSSPTGSSTLTPTPTLTLTPADSPVPTWTATPSATPLLTGSATATYTATLSSTPTASPAASSSSTATSSPTDTPVAAPPTSTSTPTATPALTPLASGPPGVVMEARPVFNPQPGGRLRIAVRLDGRVDELSFKLYSVSLRLVVDESVAGPWEAGWHHVAFDLPELANGTYYFRVLATGAKGPAGRPKGAAVLLLR